jgi:hypothetical protein
MKILAAPCLLLAALACGASLAAASAPPDAACEREGRQAQQLAQARDRGLGERQAIDALLAEDAGADREKLAEAAALLFRRFRRMEPEQARFEFMASCMDEGQ